MPKLNWSHVQFSIVTFVAAMAALYWSMSIDLQQPYWSMMAVYIVSQPMAAAVRSKAIQRLLGTVLGATATVVLIPRLVNTPVLLCLALALWVGGCLAISLLDRSPRSYIMMLAGYTAAIVGFTSVNQPGQIFDLAVARAEEISIGIICATLAHSLWFPRPVGDVLRSRIQHWLGEADRWALDILGSGDPTAGSQDRVRLAAAASEIHIMATHLPFDTSHLRETTAVVRALHDRILMLIPILSSLSDRLAALRSERPELDEASQRAIARVSQWIGNDSPGAEAPALLQELTALGAAAERGHWYGLNQIGLFSRLQDLVNALAEGRTLLAHLHDLEDPLPPALQTVIANASARPLHSDIGLSLLSGAAATVSILISCTAWIALGWAEGGASAMIASILCCLFAAMDDPVPAIKMFGVSICVAVLLAGVYVFLIFPAIDSFPMLVMTLAPTLLTIGVVTLNPRLAMPSMITLLNFCNYMAIQERLNPDFAVFLNTNLSQFFGVFVAIYVTRTVRSMSAEASARRLLRQTWKSLADLARGKTGEEHEAFTSRMVDRIGLLAPRLAAAKDEELSGIDALKDLRVSMDLAVLQDIRADLPPQAQAMLEQLLQGVGQHYSARSAGRQPKDDQLLPLLDHTVSMLSRHLPADATRPLAALVGLRRNLFPQDRFLAGGPELSGLAGVAAS